MAKATKFCSLLHSTCGLDEASEVESTAKYPLHSTLHQGEVTTDLDPPKPKKSPESSRTKDLCSSVREWSQLQELVGILATLSLSNRPGTELSLCVVLPVSSYSASSSSVYLMRLITWSDQWTHLRSDPCAVFKGSLLNVRMDGWPSSTCSRLPIW